MAFQWKLFRRKQCETWSWFGVCCCCCCYCGCLVSVVYSDFMQISWVVTFACRASVVSVSLCSVWCKKRTMEMRKGKCSHQCQPCRFSRRQVREIVQNLWDSDNAARSSSSFIYIWVRKRLSLALCGVEYAEDEASPNGKREQTMKSQHNKCKSKPQLSFAYRLSPFLDQCLRGYANYDLRMCGSVSSSQHHHLRVAR